MHGDRGDCEGSAHKLEVTLRHKDLSMCCVLLIAVFVLDRATPLRALLQACTHESSSLGRPVLWTDHRKL